MAIMIPSFPYGFDPKSREDEMFASIEKLPNEYYVFYSFKLVALKDDSWKEKEIDFVIYNRDKGVMFIEAKAGSVRCDHGIWKYGNGDEMRDPFKQAIDGRWRFKKDLEELQKFEKDKIADRCKFAFAVWFPSLFSKQVDKIILPQNADRSVILTAEDMDNPVASIERIFSYDICAQGQTNLSKKDEEFLLNHFLCPTFNIIPPKSFELDFKRKRFDAMLAEQSGLLNYLEFQRNAVINGAAGTGKTMIAVEKARRHSQSGETVLFLCFNNKLKEYLEKMYSYPGVSYYTIDGFACKLCSTATADFNDLESILLEYDDNVDEFPYRHVIIDEGQDFGQDRIHADTIFELLEDIVLKTPNGTFYVFYDRLQVVQSEKVPSFIENADCRLTLYKNCRNTKRIAETSFKPLKLEKQPKLFDSALTGDAPQIAFCPGNECLKLDAIIKKSIADGLDNIQIVSCVGTGSSVIEKQVVDDFYQMKAGKIPFSTARKFKGLEADHVILVDVDKKLLEEESMLFYVAASRAKFQLSVISSLSNQDCTDVLEYFGTSVKKNDPKETLAKLMGCKQIEA